MPFFWVIFPLAFEHIYRRQRKFFASVGGVKSGAHCGCVRPAARAAPALFARPRRPGRSKRAVTPPACPDGENWTALVAPPISIGGVLPAAVLSRSSRRLLPSFAAKGGLRPPLALSSREGEEKGKLVGRASARPSPSFLRGFSFCRVQTFVREKKSQKVSFSS